MASLHAMPFLIMNYGAEMIFILEQRLQAQAVTREKSARVLQDVLNAMFAPGFLDELMKPQGIYTSQEVREIFDKLAHASIMRLSENSMEKLFELMTTGTKHAFVTARSPTDLIEMTMNHFDSIVASVGIDIPSVNSAIERFTTMASGLSIGELADVQQTLLTYFAAKKIKVTLFLQEKLQNSDGSFNIHMGGPVAQQPATEMPGAIRYFAAGKVVKTAAFTHPKVSAFQPCPVGNAVAVNPFIAAQRTTALGRNIFLTERKKEGGVQSPTGASPPTPTDGGSSTNGGDSGQVSRAHSLAAAAASQPKSMRTKDISTDVPATIGELKASSSFCRVPGKVTTTTAALNALAGFIGTSSAAAGPAASKDLFKMSNLFGEEDAAAGGGDPDAINLPSQAVIRISAGKDDPLRNTELASVIKSMDAATGAAPNATGDDLLDLMDSA